MQRLVQLALDLFDAPPAPPAAVAAPVAAPVPAPVRAPPLHRRVPVLRLGRLARQFDLRGRAEGPWANGFFIEATVSHRQNRIVELVTFTTVEPLEKYLESVNLAALII